MCVCVCVCVSQCVRVCVYMFLCVRVCDICVNDIKTDALAVWHVLDMTQGPLPCFSHTILRNERSTTTTTNNDKGILKK